MMRRPRSITDEISDDLLACLSPKSRTARKMHRSRSITDDISEDILNSLQTEGEGIQTPIFALELVHVREAGSESSSPSTRPSLDRFTRTSLGSPSTRERSS